MDYIDQFRNQQKLQSDYAAFCSQLCDKLDTAEDASTDLIHALERLVALPPQKLQQMLDFSAKLTRLREAFHRSAEEKKPVIEHAVKSLPDFLAEMEILSASEIQQIREHPIGIAMEIECGILSRLLQHSVTSLREKIVVVEAVESKSADVIKCIDGITRQAEADEIPDDLLVKLDELTHFGDKIEEILDEYSNE